MMPFLGYLIIYNDVISYLYCNTWKDFLLTSDESSATCQTGFDFSIRLHLLYLGLFFLGLGSILFSVFCPRMIKKYSDEADYTTNEKNGTSDFNLGYMCKALERGGPPFKSGSPERAKQLRNVYGNLITLWVEGKANFRHGEFNDDTYQNAKTDLMRDYYWLNDTRRNYWALWLCLFTFSVGAVLVFIPSALTFFRVVRIVARDVFSL